MVKNKHHNLAEKYWNNLLSGYITLARFPNDFYNNESKKFSMIQKSIKKTAFRNMLSYCEKNSINLDSLLDTVFGIVLQKFTHEDDVVFGKNSNLLPIRINTNNYNMRFIDFCRSIMNQTIESHEYSYYVGCSSTFKNAVNDKLINTAFLFNVFDDNSNSDEQLDKLDMYMRVSVHDGLKIKLMYRQSYYDKNTARSVVYLFKYILQQIISNPEIRLREIQNMKEEHRDLFTKTNESNIYEFDKTVGYLNKLKEQIEKTPENIAICDINKSITYREMDEITDKIAAYLNHIGIGVGDTVAVLQERTIYVPLAAISVIKAGAVFFPIDRANPDERLGYLLEDGQAKVILTCDSLLERIKSCGWKYDIVSMDDETVRNNDFELKINKYNPKGEAYRISTSGTTGRPKCISIRHESLMNMCYYSIDYIKATEKDKCGIYLSFSFDAIMKQIFPYLLVGASVDVIPEISRVDEYSLESYCMLKGITILALPSILGKLFVMNCSCPTLRVLQVGGDKFKGYRKRNYEIYNEYGPAEFTVLCTQFHVDKYYEQVPVGKAVYNTEIYVLDKYDNICSVGMPGELCLSGIQIANGYLNNEEQNKSSFVKNPFAHDENSQIMYRTGDLAKWIDDEGTISVLGRMDSQIKINGIRIEIFEIENMINMIPEIKNSVVVKREDENGENYLDAYFVPYEDYYEEKKVEGFLMENLPPHMIPRNIARLCVLPVTPIGKVDKKSLPKL
ncbi:MAG: AMP-binding protein [Peptostreptococcus porci]|uniref:AMP-binding protein n=1 Tax=Peptostreptococcus porci TaxID=2652282 RepID=UPI002A764251|nr:AMP-binding protein [Peptostreptococcus porci]MDY2794024.1 AMP-binding protein [Peptostreptococcus porci]MDY5479700.1 AMP-binding protein [Peptostreptococcus porci]